MLVFEKQRENYQIWREKQRQRKISEINTLFMKRERTGTERKRDELKKRESEKQKDIYYRLGKESETEIEGMSNMGTARVHSTTERERKRKRQSYSVV